MQPASPTSRRELRVAAGLCSGYGLVLWLLGIVFHRIGDYGVETDFYWEYVRQARAAQSGELVVDFFRGPAYPWVLAVTELLTGEFLIAGMLVASAATAATAFGTYWLGRRWLSVPTAAFAAALVALTPVMVQHSYAVGTDTFFAALTTLAIALYATSGTCPRRAAVAGAVAGVAALTRYNALGLVILVPLAAALFTPATLRERARSVAAGWGASLALIVPWGLYTRAVEGEFLYNQNWRNVAFEIHGVDRVSWDDFFFGADHFQATGMAQVLLMDPLATVTAVLGNIPQRAAGDAALVHWTVALLALAGVLRLLGPRVAREARVFTVGWLSLLLPLLLVFYNARFTICLIPGYALFAATALDVATRWSGWRSRGALVRRAGVVAIGLLLSLTAARSWSWNSLRIGGGPVEVLELSSAFHSGFGDAFGGERISARKPHIAHYIGREFMLIPREPTIAALLEALREERVGLLYISAIEVMTQPHLRPLIEPSNPPYGLVPLLASEDPPAVLYQVLLPASERDGVE